MEDEELSSILFEAFIDQVVLKAVGRGSTSFDALLLALPSVYPSSLLHSLRRLVLRPSYCESFTRAPGPAC